MGPGPPLSENFLRQLGERLSIPDDNLVPWMCLTSTALVEAWRSHGVNSGDRPRRTAVIEILQAAVTDLSAFRTDTGGDVPRMQMPNAVNARKAYALLACASVPMSVEQRWATAEAEERLRIVNVAIGWAKRDVPMKGRALGANAGPAFHDFVLSFYFHTASLGGSLEPALSMEQMQRRAVSSPS
jgi:hypothetical protein